MHYKKAPRSDDAIPFLTEFSQSGPRRQGSLRSRLPRDLDCCGAALHQLSVRKEWDSSEWRPPGYDLVNAFATSAEFRTAWRMAL